MTAAPPASPPSSPSAYALVAAADPPLAARLAEAARAASLPPVTVSDGRAALELVATRGAPGLLLCDLVLCRLDGFSLVAALRAQDPALPVLTVCAFPALRAAVEPWQRRPEIGPVQVLAKSATEEELRDTLRRALRRQPAAPSAGPAAPSAAAAAQEAARLEKLDGLGLLREQDDGRWLQDLVADTARRFSVPVALVSLLLRDRQWFRAQVGLSEALRAEGGTPRGWALGRHAVEAQEPLVVPDARRHPCFHDNPLVRAGDLRGYAAAPIITSDGHALGTLCLGDQRPLELGPAQLDLLVTTARRLAGELELRAARRGGACGQDPELRAAALPFLEALLGAVDSGVLLKGEGRRLLYANQALCDMLDLPLPELLRLDRDQLLTHIAELTDDPEGFLRQSAALVPREGPYAAQCDVLLRRPARRLLRWQSRPVPLPAGTGHLSLFRDLTADADLLRERERLALTDPLTGLANRRGGEEALGREVARARRGKGRLCVALLDVDRFKDVNDRCGHGEGDRILRALASSLGGGLRASDVLSRWGGDELLMVLPDAPLPAAVALLERLRRGTAALRTSDGARVTLSAGVAELQPGEEAKALIARADAQLYAAKGAGRDGVRPAL